MKPHHLLPLCFLIAAASLKAESSPADDNVPTTLTGAVKDGKVEVKITRRLSWIRKPYYPVTVSLRDKKRVPFITSTVTSGTTVELSGVLSPGEYTIYSGIDTASGYWGGVRRDSSGCGRRHDFHAAAAN